MRANKRAEVDPITDRVHGVIPLELSAVRLGCFRSSCPSALVLRDVRAYRLEAVIDRPELNPEIELNDDTDGDHNYNTPALPRASPLLFPVVKGSRPLSYPH